MRCWRRAPKAELHDSGGAGLMGNNLKKRGPWAVAGLLIVAACAGPPDDTPVAYWPEPVAVHPESDARKRLSDFAVVRLESNLALLTARQKQTLGLLIQAAEVMDDLFWKQAYGNRADLLPMLSDPSELRLAQINYGAWDRHDGNRSFLSWVDAKPLGAGFYPADMSFAEFESAALRDKRDPYTVLRRDPWGKLETIPYHQAYRRDLVRAARLLGQAATASPEPAFRRYLTLRARSLITDDYLSSDIAWMGLRDNTLDVVIGPVDYHEDALLGYKTAYAGWVLIRDKTWAHRLNLMVELLPRLQDDLPVASLYRSEMPVVDAPPDAYDAVLYTGAANAGVKAVAVNLPADVRVSSQFGTRRLHFRNVMSAEFEHIVRPIAAEMIVPDQQENVNFEAYFGHTMMREMAHQLGPRTTVNDRGTLRQALREHHGLIEEGKAEILGLYILDWLDRQQQLSGPSLMDYLVTSVATTLRAIRSGETSPQAISDIIRFNFLVGLDAISRDQASGRYRIHPQRMRSAITALSSQLLVLQGNGDYPGVDSLIRDLGYVTPALQMDLQRLKQARVPVGLVFEQGADVLGLK